MFRIIIIPVRVIAARAVILAVRDPLAREELLLVCDRKWLVVLVFMTACDTPWRMLCVLTPIRDGPRCRYCICVRSVIDHDWIVGAFATAFATVLLRVSHGSRRSKIWLARTLIW